MRIRGHIPFPKTARTFGGASDPIPSIKGVALYLDGANTSKSETTGDPSWTDSSNNGVIAEQTISAQYPTRDEANRKWSFSTNDFFLFDKQVWLSHAGFRLFLAIDRTSTGDDVILGSDASGSGQMTALLFRAASTNISIHGTAGVVFSSGVGADLCLIEINYDGAGNWTLIKDGSTLDTKTLTLAKAGNGTPFNQIGKQVGTTQYFDGDVLGIVLYNGQDATKISTIRTAMQEKFIDKTMEADIAYKSYATPSINLLAMYGDSFTVGRSPDSELTGGYAYLADAIANTEMYNQLTCQWETYDAGTRYSAQMLANDMGIEAGFFDDATSGNLAIMKVGVGGATFGTSGGAGKQLSEAQADVYPGMVKIFLTALQELRAKHYNITWNYIALLGGTNDAYNATDAGNVGTWLPAIQVSMDASFGNTFKYAAFEILTGTYLTTVNTGFSTEAWSNVNFTYISSVNNSLTDGVHWTAPASVDEGRSANSNWLGA